MHSCPVQLETEGQKSHSDLGAFEHRVREVKGKGCHGSTQYMEPERKKSVPGAEIPFIRSPATQQTNSGPVIQ